MIGCVVRWIDTGQTWYHFSECHEIIKKTRLMMVNRVHSVSLT
jgi:hypothetical protein